ncbi:uncharacterized protein LOC9632832 [Selaginella moellendorffii]|uniref:uncharacterized protein LOC9632832 n=1 Tax=Selaginella moellendorffii TaxID=88036 RepID=UPI000D1C9BB8|nr:uncharacterized protein LOC9632832 [Selaginella moellendorffii]|eukprot:XP_024528193.1 uncharacterized protein LOC9632832 [Selaginella moellendorffii]
MAAAAIENGSTFSSRSPFKEWNAQNEEVFSIRSRMLTPSNRKKFQNVTAPENNQVSCQISKLQEGLQSVTSSLSLLSDTIGSALAESFTLIESDRNCYAASPQRSPQRSESSDQNSDCITYSSSQKSPSSSSTGTEESPKFQLKPSSDLAMSMAAKAKLLLRELKTVRAELCFMRNRTSQLEEENRKMRGSMSKGNAPEEDDLVRRQLETLLAEKARLVQENATYKRENQFLHEAIEYHQLTVQGMVLPE